MSLAAPGRASHSCILQMTPEETKQLDLAHDVLHTVKTWPEHAPAWWRLTGCIDGLGEELKARFLAQVHALQFASPQAQWFKHSALHYLSGNNEFLVRQAELAPGLPDPERWMTLVNLVWWNALSRASDRNAFRRMLLDAHLPQLLDSLGRGLARAPGGSVPRLGVKRVAIFAQHLSTGHHAATALTFDLRALLEGAGIDTRVFASQELSLPGMSGYSAGGWVSSLAPIDPATWQLRIPGQAAVTVADVRFSVSARWNSLERTITSYDPDVVLFVGFFSPLIWALRQRYPVLGMSLHTLPPLAPVDLWLAADPQPGARHDWPELARPATVHFPFRFWPTAVSIASRSEIGVRDDSVLLVTCGGRLEPETLAGWIDDVIGFLDEQPQVEWLLVGLAESQCGRFEQKHARIRVLPQRADLAGWIRLSDLYLNPPRVGGGASVAMAMELGVPVVSMAGGDGGDKIGALAVQSAGAYRQRLSEWVADTAKRTQAGEHLKAKFRDELDISSPAAARRLADACHQAQQCFGRRQLPNPFPALSVDEQR